MEHLQRYRWPITVVLILLAVLGVYGLSRPALSSPPPELQVVLVYTPTPLPTATPVPTPTPAPIQVYVSGAVVRPGVYALPPEARVVDALEAAGGPVEEADLVHLNLAQRVHDEEQVHVPRVGEPTYRPAAPSTGAPNPAGEPAGALVNINTATVEELVSLPGIGSGYAQRIVDYRESNGPFQSIEEIQNVPGIGAVTFARIQALITVGW